MTAPATHLRDDVRDLVAVCGEVLRDQGSWVATRDAGPGAVASVERELATLAGIGLLGARQLPSSDGGLTLAEAAAVMEVVGAEMASVDVAGALAAGPVLTELDPTLAHAVAHGRATVAVAVADEATGSLRACAGPGATVLAARAGSVALVDRSALTGPPNEVDPSRPVVTGALADLTDGRAVDAALAAATALGHEVLVAAEAVGAARSACSLTTAYVKDRAQFGRSIGSFQAVKHSLADAWCDVEVASAAVQAAASAVDADPRGAPTAVAVSVATALDALLGTAERAIHLHGGMGVAWESGMHAFLRRALALRALLDPDRRCERIVLAHLRGAA